jgi:hypothetical protein
MCRLKTDPGLCLPWLRAGLIRGLDGKAAVTKAKGDIFEDVALLEVTTQM